MQAPTAAPPEAQNAAFERLMTDIDLALEAVGKLGEPERTTATRLKKALEGFHAHVLTNVVRLLKADPQAHDALYSLVEDPAIRTALMMHGIMKPNLTHRVAKVIELVRPYTQSHGGDVELVKVEGDTVFVRLHGSCNGCSLSSVTLRNGVEEALKEHVPEVKHIEVVPTEPGPALIPLDAVDILDDTGWIEGPAVADLDEHRPYRLHEADAYDIVIVRVDGKLHAYKNACAHMGLPLDGGLCSDGVLTCPWHGFRFDVTSGECLTVPQAQLEPYPLRVEDGVVWVRPDGD